jgi:uncharacterized membrane protein YbjE (DUF340 family)
MLYVTIILAAGVATGFVLRKKGGLLDTVEKVTPWTVYALLFFLGISLGVNKDVVSNLSRLGLQAFVLSIGGVAGSISFIVLLYRLLFKRRRRV